MVKSDQLAADYNVFLVIVLDVSITYLADLSLDVQLQQGPRAKSLQLPPQWPGRPCFGTPPVKEKEMYPL